MNEIKREELKLIQVYNVFSKKEISKLLKL